MHLIVFFFGSGIAFFLGVGCVLAAVVASFGRWRGSLALSTILAALGVIIVLLSGTPLPDWVYAVSVALTVIWMVRVRRPTSTGMLGRRNLAAVVVLVCAAGALFELRFQRMPEVPPVSSHRLYLFGDSLAAGITDEKARNWPQLLAQSHRLELGNYSRAGATTAVALRAAKGVTFDEGVVLLEIGGNDMLGSTSVKQFEQDLETLLKLVTHSSTRVVMFELPVPPLHNGYGKVQRRLAAKYQVSLIPKRVLTGIIAGKGTTTDSLHLTEAGHREMAAAVWEVIGPAYSP